MRRAPRSRSSAWWIDWPRATPDWPRFRVGIATGPALVGNVGSDEVRSYSAIGDTVNLAARLESWAQVGHVVISSATAERLADVATLVPVGALELKGKTALVEAYELIDLVSEANRGDGSGDQRQRRHLQRCPAVP